MCHNATVSAIVGGGGGGPSVCVNNLKTSGHKSIRTLFILQAHIYSKLRMFIELMLSMSCNKFSC